MGNITSSFTFSCYLILTVSVNFLSGRVDSFSYNYRANTDSIFAHPMKQKAKIASVFSGYFIRR